jgi:hypothetical protein
MPDEPTDAPPAPLGTVEAIAPLWEVFRKGGVVDCPRDAGPMALSVDGMATAYRLVCVKCGLATPWFEAKFAHIALKGTLPLEAGTSEE